MSVMKKFFLDRKSAVLVVIDVQDKLCKAMDSTALDTLIDNISILLETAEALNIPVITTEQYTRGLGETISMLREKLPSPAIEKMSFSCCSEQAFLEKLSSLERPQVIVTGMEAHVCVLQTVLELLDKGFQVHVVNDAVISRKKDNQMAGVAMAAAAGAVISTTEAAMFQLLRVAGTEEFKKLSKLVR